MAAISRPAEKAKNKVLSLVPHARRVEVIKSLPLSARYIPQHEPETLRRHNMIITPSEWDSHLVIFELFRFHGDISRLP